MQFICLKVSNFCSYFVHVFAILHFCTAEAIVKLPENATIPAVFTFGDSIVDTGNNNDKVTLSKCNFPPYGRDFIGGQATGRFSNGKFPSDLIVEQLGIKELLPPYLDPHLQTNDLLTGVNFASSGSGYDPLTSHLVLATSLREQLHLFKEYIDKIKGLVGEERAISIMSNSLFLVTAGTDDIANTYFHTPTRILEYNVSVYTDYLASSASLFLQDLHKFGARRIGVFSTPPVGCLPSQRTLGGGRGRKCVETYNQAAELLNFKLSKVINNLNSKLPHAKLVYVDDYNLLNDMIKNPKKYGFEVSDRGCCGTGIFEVAFMCNKWNPFTCRNASNYVFWDSYHPTEKAYRVMVNQLLQYLINKIST